MDRSFETGPVQDAQVRSGPVRSGPVWSPVRDRSGSRDRQNIAVKWAWAPKNIGFQVLQNILVTSLTFSFFDDRIAECLQSKILNQLMLRTAKKY